MNEKLVAGLMSGFGMKFLGLMRGTGIPTRVAMVATSASEVELWHVRAVELGDPDRVAQFNADWYALATEFGLFSAERQFLVMLTPAIDPVFDQARESTDDWEDPAWWEHVWGLVELEGDWDLAGAGAASGVLGSGYACPAFVMSATDGSVFVVGAVWRDSIGVAVLPAPHCSAGLQEVARRDLGSRRTEGEREDLLAWLARGEDCHL
ncbi:hypothetical protein ABZ897_10760 [Nonomuraea sp. NPDC046802]|uniref:hypothetical protein n=1 Tax=Nonomuraea sp. NPDC046802 TaxID=3154919 RepID=UPI0033BFB9DE